MSTSFKYADFREKHSCYESRRRPDIFGVRCYWCSRVELYEGRRRNWEPSPILSLRFVSEVCLTLQGSSGMLNYDSHYLACFDEISPLQHSGGENAGINHSQEQFPSGHYPILFHSGTATAARVGDIS